MKTIGIVAITEKAASMAYCFIIKESIKINKQQHPEIILQNSSLHLYYQAILQLAKGETRPLIELIESALKKLHLMGAEIAFIPNNAVHQIFGEIEQISPVKLISIVDSVVVSCCEHNYKSICLIGPSTVINSKIFSNPLKAKGIEVITPSISDQEYMQSIITKASVTANVTEQELMSAYSIIESLEKQYTFDALLVTCSDLLSILKIDSFHIPVINPFQVIAQKVLDYASLAPDLTETIK